MTLYYSIHFMCSQAQYNKHIHIICTTFFEKKRKSNIIMKIKYYDSRNQ